MIMILNPNLPHSTLSPSPSPPSAATTIPPPHQYPPRVASIPPRSEHTRAPVRFPSHSRQSSSAPRPQPPCHPPTNSPNTRSGLPQLRRRYPRRVASTMFQTSSPTPQAVPPSHSPPTQLLTSVSSRYYYSNTPPGISRSPTSRHPATTYSSSVFPPRQ